MADPNIESIARELAASGDPITAVGVQGKRTLRQAIANVYWKVSSTLTLADRPRNRKEADDQFGHVLSTRAEVLYNQALLEAIIERINDPSGEEINVAAIRDKVIGGFK